MSPTLRAQTQALVTALEARRFLLPKQRRLLAASREMLRLDPPDSEIARVANQMHAPGAMKG